MSISRRITCDVLRRENDIDFLSFRLWIGVWVALFLLLSVALDLSALIRYITRFTEESFAVLISVIFMYESFVNIADIWTTHPVRTSDAEPCYCSLLPASDNRSAVSDADDDHHQVERVAVVTIQPDKSRLNNSFYRLNTLPLHRVLSQDSKVGQSSAGVCGREATSEIQSLKTKRALKTLQGFAF